jgi:hypothetical protein
MFTFNGRPVTHPIAKVFCAIVVGLGLLWVGLCLMLLPLLLVIAMVADPFLRVVGRRGCIRKDGDSLSVIFDKTSFERSS